MTTAQGFIEACNREVGTVETPTNRTRYATVAGHANGYAWCHTFLAAMAVETGLQLPDGTIHDGTPDAVIATAYTPTGANVWRRAGRWFQVPQPGDWAYIDFPGDGVNRISHVALVTQVLSDGRTIYTIEGNTSSGISGSQRDGGGVYRRTRDRSVVVGYGRPHYAVLPKAAPLPPHRTTTFEDPMLRRIDLQMDIDKDGHGHTLINARKANVVSVVFNTVNPPDSGYKPVPDWAALDVAGKARIVLEEALPDARLDISVWVVG